MEVVLYGERRDAETLGDFGVRQSPGSKAGNFSFPASEPKFTGISFGTWRKAANMTHSLPPCRQGSVHFQDTEGGIACQWFLTCVRKKFARVTLRIETKTLSGCQAGPAAFLFFPTCFMRRQSQMRKTAKARPTRLMPAVLSGRLGLLSSCMGATRRIAAAMLMEA